MFHQLLGQAFLALMLLVCGWALWRGDKPERLAAAAMVAAWIGTSFVLDRRFKDIQWATLGVDFALLVVLIGLSLVFRRRWLLAASGFHLLGVATHGAMIIDPKVQATPYIVALGVWSCATVASLAVGMAALTRSRAAVR
ncbi:MULTISPECIES: hypothetical protein [unclassified Caulobacter]|uniref:hypothetical protein n=1 Tax=unclassified Caulobacter TaxID=2648921 RepID=UPI0006FB3C32|nr:MULTISPECIES: hypothetical protein [unclassified Caulobacter]KQV56179.1 hypothetical protein ASC62_20005 [Caulobacter sp. Root342]KQV70645.1 hypothetical protein ASC70_03250 [Caulobacter sp. Root343]